MNRKTVIVNDKMQKRFGYVLTQPIGKNFDPEFKPELTPKQMLSLGIFGGKYMTDAARNFRRTGLQKQSSAPNAMTRR